MLGRPLRYGACTTTRPGVDKALDILASEAGRIFAQTNTSDISVYVKLVAAATGTQNGDN